MKYIRLLLPFSIFLILLYLYFNFKSNFTKKNTPLKSVKTQIAKPSVPKISFLSDYINNTNQSFSINLPSDRSSYYSFSFNKTPYQIASNLGISSPPVSSTNNQFVWQGKNNSLVYSNSSYFYTIKNKAKKTNIYTYANTILSQDFKISTVNFHKNIKFLNGKTVLYYYPTINGNFIYKPDGVKFYDEFIFTDSNIPVSFSIYPFNINKKHGYPQNFNLNKNTLSKSFSYINTSLAISNISFTSQSQGYFIDLKNNYIVPIYILSGKADIINSTTLPIFIYVPEIKTKS
jgi:hypothetical protein